MIRFAIVFMLLFLSGCQPLGPLTRLKDSLGNRAAQPLERALATTEELPAEPTEVLPGNVTPPGDSTTTADSVTTLPAKPGTRGPVPYYGDFPLTQHPRVDKLIASYSGPQKRTFGLWLERAARYIPRIQEIFAEEKLPLDLAYLAMIESGFNLRAYSWAHAAGPWQFIEGTGRTYGLDNDWWHDERLDLDKSTRAAAQYLKYLYKRFDGDWYLAVAGYNAGCGTVGRAVDRAGSRDFWTLADGHVLRAETKKYLPKLLAALTIVKDLERYGFTGLNYDAPLVYDEIVVETVTDLALIARFAGVDEQQIKNLNPELKRWSTVPGVKNYRLRIPAGSAARVKQQYQALPADQRASYLRHKVASGDTLGGLAQRYHIRVADIVKLNKIKNARALQIGQNLILPLRQGADALPKIEDSYVRNRRQTYKVRSGDNLWSIARRFDVTEKQLRQWNNLGWSNLLRPGQQLAVSGSAAKPARSGKKKMVYRVMPGDTLWDIAQQFNVSADQIRSWNALSRNHVLRPGQELTLLVSARRQG